MRLFKFIIRYLGFLKTIPLLPHAFDALMRMFSVCFRKEITEAMYEVQEELGKENGVTISIHKYGGMQFNYRNKELGHVHGNGMVDVLLNRKRKAELIKRGWVQEHHTFKNSGWITIFLKDRNDAKTAITVLRISKKRIESLK